MIRRVVLRRFKRFERRRASSCPATSCWPARTTAARPRCSRPSPRGAWRSTRWKQLNDFQRHGGDYAGADRAPGVLGGAAAHVRSALARAGLPGQLEIEIQSARRLDGGDGASSPTAPSRSTCGRSPHGAPEVVRSAELATAVSSRRCPGWAPDEPVYQRPKIDQLLGQAKPGDVLRNLLVEAASPRRPGRACRSRSAGCSASSCRRRMPRARTSWPSTASARRGPRSTSRARGAASSRC